MEKPEEQLAIFSSRLEIIHRYSLKGEKITFDESELKPYRLISDLELGKRVDPKYPSVKKGWRKYRRKIFKMNESRIRYLLLTLLDYERKVPMDNTLEVYCHNGLFSDLLNAKEGYYVVQYKNKLIFASTSTRANQNQLLSYIGVKFEALMKCQPSPRDCSHCKLLLNGEYGRWPFKSVVEVDAFKKTPRGKVYCEMKLCYSSNAKEYAISKLTSNREFLEFLRINVKSFRKKIEKWLFQAYFGRQDILVVGLRDDDFKLICNTELKVIEEIIPFVRQTYPSLYEKFINAPQTVSSSLDTIHRQIKQLQRTETDVFLLDTSFPLNVERCARKFETIIIPEFLEQHPLDPLSSLTESLDKLSVGRFA
ncbi:hypothetical protein JL09_g5012 [Pichia kudriavzevii]|uniref:Decapping nuclease n=1 Tax=Pichia kudriavzevii TaxID=4909 RepID=A0A099NSN6_PICKU|nr:hypothetical protein JL09_g5012 [Pichia kudriavzevii]